MKPSVELTERVPQLCRLGADDVDFLHGRHRAHVEIAPTRRRRVFRLTARGHVGTIVAPGCRLLLRPKVPIESLFHMLEPGDPVPLTDDRAEAVPGMELLDFLAGRLVSLMAERAAHGLHRAYVEHSAAGPFVQGRLEVPAQMRAPPSSKDRLHCRYEEFTADVPCNQLPRSTAELVLGSALLGAGARQSLTRVLQAFAAIGPVPLHTDTFEQAAQDRLTAAYTPLLDLCRLLAASLGPGRTSGDICCPSFLLDMERVFERYVSRGLAAVIADAGCADVVVQPLFHPGGSARGRPMLSMRPDLTVHKRGRPCLVIDAKWKRSPRVRSDLYQVLAYCAALGFAHGVLVYPGRRDRAWDYRFAETGLCIAIHTLRVVGRRVDCRESLEALGRRLRQVSELSK